MACIKNSRRPLKVDIIKKKNDEDKWHSVLTLITWTRTASGMWYEMSSCMFPIGNVYIVNVNVYNELKESSSFFSDVTKLLFICGWSKDETH